MRVPKNMMRLAIVWTIVTYSASSWSDNRTPVGTGEPMPDTLAERRQETTQPPSASESLPSVDGAAPDSAPGQPEHPATPETPVDDVTQRDEDDSGGPPPQPADATPPAGQADKAPTEAEPASPAPPPSNNQSVPEPDVVWSLVPKFTRSLTPIIAGHNDSNPIWSPSGSMLAFERSVGDQRKIVIALRDGTIIKTIYFETPEEEGVLDLYLPGITDTASYNAGMSWSGDNNALVFMSNGGSGNYDLYLLPDFKQHEPMRLTRHSGKESHPHWSPMGNRLVFVSGSTGKADIFTMDLATRQRRQITRGKKMYLYPQWSPDGLKIAMIYGSNENHDIYIVEDLASPQKSTRALTTWAYDDLRPVWSPDGSKIAFYSNYNMQGDQKLWCIIVVKADGSDISTGDALSANVVAHQVIPDIEQGPAWMPDSRHIVYVRNDEQMFNPIYLVDIDEKTPIAIQTHTKMNHDVSCAMDGTLAFRAQVEQWDHIYIAEIDPEMAAIEEVK